MKFIGADKAKWQLFSCKTDALKLPYVAEAFLGILFVVEGNSSSLMSAA
ncbi:MAG TPA: hypothetical protein VIE89_31695 [Candidatus Binatia bacterium]|jgi:hypothetical protein